jgi:uncharacterized protein YkwD
MIRTPFMSSAFLLFIFIFYPFNSSGNYVSIPVDRSDAVILPGVLSNAPVTQLDKGKILKLVNFLRSSGRYCGSGYENAARPLVWNEKLERAARLHSLDMYRQNYLDHRSKDGSPFNMRIKRQAYKYFACAENIALGYENEEAVMEGWTKSAGHCSNFMNDTYTEIGIARTGKYWVMVLAAPDNFVQEIKNHK